MGTSKSICSCNNRQDKLDINMYDDQNNQIENENTNQKFNVEHPSMKEDLSPIKSCKKGPESPSFYNKSSTNQHKSSNNTDCTGNTFNNSQLSYKNNQNQREGQSQQGRFDSTSVSVSNNSNVYDIFYYNRNRDKVIYIQKAIRRFYKRKQTNQFNQNLINISNQINQYQTPNKNINEMYFISQENHLKDKLLGSAIKSAFKNKNFKYSGNYQEGLKHGFGCQTWKDGSRFTGYFYENKASFIGIFEHKAKDKYIGEFKFDMACGFGTYIHSDGAFYEGEWNDDCQNGFGIENWSDGNSYIGEYSQGKKEGFGKYSWSDGMIYEGEWKDNALNGYGRYTFSDGKLYIGEFKNNAMNGYGEFEWLDGKKYKGNYKNDKKDGFGIYYWPEPDRIYVGYWKNGRQEGIGKFITPKYSKWGLWNEGERKKWYSNKEEAIKENSRVEVNVYENYFNMTIQKGLEFIRE
jgi:hypothetical protein